MKQEFHISKKGIWRDGYFWDISNKFLFTQSKVKIRSSWSVKKKISNIKVEG